MKNLRRILFLTLIGNKLKKTRADGVEVAPLPSGPMRNQAELYARKE